MKLRYCFLSFLVMGWGYYELSGGADFVPASRAGTGAGTGAAPSAQAASGPTGAAGGSAPTATLDDALAPADAPPGSTAGAIASARTTPGDTAPALRPADAPPGDTPEVVSRAAAGPLDVLPAPASDRPAGPLAGAAPEQGSLAGADRRTLATTGGDDLADTALTVAGNRVVSVSAAPEAPLGAAARGDLREVAGSRVNMRTGPGMGHDVLVTLPRGTAAQVVGSSNGWAHVVLEGDGREGWIAERLLRDAPG